MPSKASAVESSLVAWPSRSRNQPEDAIVLLSSARRHGTANPAGSNRLPLQPTAPSPPPHKPNPLDRGPSSRGEWPWGFMQDLPSCEDEDLLERMDEIVAIFRHECAKRANIPRDQRAKSSDATELVLTTNGHLVSKYSQRLQLFTVHSDVHMADATLAEVVELLQAPDDGFLRRIFSDQDMIQLHTLATIGAATSYDTHDADNGMQQLHVPTSCTLKKVLFREKGIFLTHPKEILFLDHVQPISPTSVLRVFKSIDNGNYPTTSRDHVVPRHTHIMGGYLVERFNGSTLRPGGVRVTYYAEHAVYPKQFASSLDTRSRLEKFGLCMSSWAQVVLSHRRQRNHGGGGAPDTRLLAVCPPTNADAGGVVVDAACRICDKGFHWFRRACTCSVCGGGICADCSALESVVSPNGLQFKVPVCFMCLVQIKASNQHHDRPVVPRSVGTTLVSNHNPLAFAPVLDDDGDDDEGWSESSLGLPPQRRSTLRPAKCQTCATRQSEAQCVVCGMFFCGQCADTGHASVVCRTCKPPSSRPHSPVLLLSPQVVQHRPGSTALDLPQSANHQLSPLSSLLSSPSSSPPPTWTMEDLNDGFGRVPNLPRMSALSDEMHIRLRDTYTSTVPSSAAVLQDTSFSSVEDLMAMYPMRRFAPADLRFSDDIKVDPSSPTIDNSLAAVPPNDKLDLLPPSSSNEDSPAALPREDQSPSTSASSQPPSPSAALDAVTPADVEAACLDISSNSAYDALCEEALVAMECSNAYVVLLYKDQFMLKGAAGTGYVPASIPVTCAFCVHTVASVDPLIVPDATVDGRFQDSVRVRGKEAARFYYGLLLQTDSQVFGTVCVMDTSPRMRIGRNQKQAMDRFARQVGALVHGRRPIIN
ncbi:hypothetical protein B5M09_011895 [Aphanomyces astaci]|uniref:FYVE-type domain-containing protein n=1 Tax=Aphanomyces astaci TaxID=112090 RepID=A0A425CUW3_APHAT|nr:hypothetical protein B5M09_011895 [Aphanomyces astaci]